MSLQNVSFKPSLDLLEDRTVPATLSPKGWVLGGPQPEPPTKPAVQSILPTGTNQILIGMLKPTPAAALAGQATSIGSQNSATLRIPAQEHAQILIGMLKPTPGATSLPTQAINAAFTQISSGGDFNH